MRTFTIFFNSDSDIEITKVDTIYGLDRIPTQPREHLISQLSFGKASFLNRDVWISAFAIKSDVRSPYQLCYAPCTTINGPGSGYFLSDSKITNPSYSLKLTDGQLNKHWKANIHQTARWLAHHTSEEWYRIYKSEKEPEFSDYQKALNEYPRDWLMNAYHITWTADPPKTPRPPINKINLVGWGRGAISCHMLANELLNFDLASIPVNILAIDPVIGGNVESELLHTTLGANVQEYVGFYARDERSAQLPCIVPDTASNTRVHIYPIAGRHTTLIGNQAADGDNMPGTFSEPSDLVFHLATKCLNRWDPALSFDPANSGGYPDLSVSGNQVLAKLKSEYDSYVFMRNTTYSNQSGEIKGEREILLNGQRTNFKSAQGARFTPNQGLAKGHIEDMSYFQDIT